MNRKKKSFKILTLLVLLTLIISSILPMNITTTAQAANKIKLDKTALILNPGDTEILHVKGTKKKVIWTSSNSLIVTVNNKGVVIAKSEGKAVITARVSNKKLTCTVAVLRLENPYVETAPFDAQEKSFGKISAVIPKGWTCTFEGTSYMNLVESTIYPDDTDTTKANYPYIMADIINEGEPAGAYSLLRQGFEKIYTADYLKELYSDKGFENFTITQPVFDDLITRLGTTLKIKFDVTADNTVFKFTQYILQVETYRVFLTVNDSGDSITPDVNKVAEYFLNSIQINK